jgi:hypothetical protein
MAFKTREEWLKAAVAALGEVFGEVKQKVPANLRVSCGFPSSGAFAKKTRALGECWSDHCSKGKQFEIFVSPVLASDFDVIDVLTHELVHAVAGLKCGHRGQFKRIALEVGLEGPMRSCGAGPELSKRLNAICKALGKYPGDQIEKMTNGRKKQGTRLVKASCVQCGYTVRVTRKWLEVGAPICPTDGDSMLPENEEEEE